MLGRADRSTRRRGTKDEESNRPLIVYPSGAGWRLEKNGREYHAGVRAVSEPARTRRLGLRTARVSYHRGDLEPDPGLANHLLWLVNFGCLNDVKQKSSSSPIGVGYHPSTKKKRRVGRG